MKKLLQHEREQLTEAEKKILSILETQRDRVNQKFPIWTALCATFGLVSVLYGFEKFIDSVPFFTNNPWTLIVVGLFVLLITGTVYRKL